MKEDEKNGEKIWDKYDSIASSVYGSGFHIPVFLGVDSCSSSKVVDLAACNNLLVVGNHGTGKTSCLDSIIHSILTFSNSDDVKLMLIDPLKVSMSVYDGIPNLLRPVCSDCIEGKEALKQLCEELEGRLKLLASKGCRNIEDYNALNETKLAYIILIIDEFSPFLDLDERFFNDAIKRLSLSGHVCGINMVFSTSVASADVITGCIKNNFHSQICFSVPTSINSRIVLDQPGAEKLQGIGEFFFRKTDSSELLGIEGAFIDRERIRVLVNDLKEKEI